MKFLLQKGASIYDVDKQGNTPLHHACRVGRVANVNLLVESILKEGKASGADELTVVGKLNQKTRAGYSPIHLAAIGGHVEVLRPRLKCIQYVPHHALRTVRYILLQCM